MQERDIVIENTIRFVKDTLKNAEGGHDWWHVFRVWNLAKTIAAKEEVNLFVIELGALMHDIADSKFHNGDETIGAKLAKEFLHSQKLDNDIIKHVVLIIENISFKNTFNKTTFSSLELQILQDADRLDAIGAIGVARAFSYGGFKMREMYNPNIKPNLNFTKEEYKNATSPTINHFYEKLLLLKDMMNTKVGKQMAIERHEFMETYLSQFYNEWNGKY